MRRHMKTKFAFPAFFLSTIVLSGCNRDAPVTHPVKGAIVFTGGDVKLLAGSHVDAALTSDPTLRASGVIQDDGTFTLETLHGGASHRGARSGKYQVRVLLNDDEPKARRHVARLIAPRYLDFKTSDLNLEVPTTSPIVLTLSAR
jgi:hypothetical protein